MSEIPRPLSSGPDTLEAAAVAVLERVGPAWGPTAAWETGARDLWRRLTDLPWKGVALRQRAERLARAAPRLVEGTSSGLFRAARAQRLPWELDEDPLRAAGRDVAAFCAAARDVLELAEAQERAAERLAALETRWAADFPAAWQRWTGVLELDRGEVYAGDTAEELRAVNERMERLEEELARWRDEVEAWLAENGGADDDPSLGVSEERYLALLSIGAADRKSALARTAELVRRGSRAHLDALPPPGASAWDGLVRDLARAWAELAPGRPLSAEEAACYRLALAEAHARADLPRSGDAARTGKAPWAAEAAPDGRTLYATPLDAGRTDREMIVVRRSPRTPLRVKTFGADPVRGEMEVVLADSEPALSPEEVGDARRFFDTSASPVPPYWWATRSPAQFRLRQVRGGTEADGGPGRDAVLVGVLEAKGRLVQLAEPPGARPRPAGDPPLFRAWRQADPADPTLYLDRDPRVRPLAAAFRALDLDCWVAEVPEYGPGRVWLRTAAEKAAAPLPASAFDGEAELLGRLAAVLPESAVRVAHRGTVDLARRGGRTAYLATTAPLGNEAERWLRAGPERAAAWGVDLAADLLRTLGAAHAGELCLGVVAPALLRVRPAFHRSPPVLRATLAAAPLAGRAGTRIRSELRRVPRCSGSPAAGSERSPRNDLVSLGRFLADALDPWLSPDAPLRALAGELAAGALHSTDDALARLEAAAPVRMEHFRSVLRHPARTHHAAPA